MMPDKCHIRFALVLYIECSTCSAFERLQCGMPMMPTYEYRLLVGRGYQSEVASGS